MKRTLIYPLRRHPHFHLILHSFSRQLLRTRRRSPGQERIPQVKLVPQRDKGLRLQ